MIGDVFLQKKNSCDFLISSVQKYINKMEGRISWIKQPAEEYLQATKYERAERFIPSDEMSLVLSEQNEFYGQ